MDCCWNRIFDPAERSDKALDEAVQDHQALLQKLLPEEKHWLPVLRLIPGYLKGKVNSKGSCRILIGAAHIIRELPPSPALAETIWKGAYNYSDWARGISIGAAVSHWARLGRVAKEEGAVKLRQWNAYALTRYREGDKDWCVPSDGDFCALIAGVWKLVNDKEAIEIIESEDFCERFKSTVVSHLIMIVRFMDTGFYRHPIAPDLVEKWWSHIQASPTASRVAGYLYEHYDYSVPMSVTLPTIPKGEVTHAGTVAIQAGSEGLEQYVLKYEGTLIRRL